MFFLHSTPKSKNKIIVFVLFIAIFFTLNTASASEDSDSFYDDDQKSSTSSGMYQNSIHAGHTPVDISIPKIQRPNERVSIPCIQEHQYSPQQHPIRDQREDGLNFIYEEDIDALSQNPFYTVPPSLSADASISETCLSKLKHCFSCLY